MTAVVLLTLMAMSPGSRVAMPGSAPRSGRSPLSYLMVAIVPDNCL